MRRRSITEPKFGKIFAVRFLISLAIFALLANYCLYKLDDYVWRKVDDEQRFYLDKIVNSAQTLSKEEPGSDQYKKELDELKLKMAYYQTFNHSYVEVTLGKETVSIGDTAYFILFDYQNPKATDVNDASVTDEYYLIEDISYLDPLNEYKDGMFNEKEQLAMYRKWARDPIFQDVEHIGKYDSYRSHMILTAYINREHHTFLPGLISVTYLGQTYEVDCTPKDTKGYEMVDFRKYDGSLAGNGFFILYRETTGLSAADFLWHIVPDADLMTNEIYYEDYPDYLSKGLLNNKEWQIGYTAPNYPIEPALMLAPVSSAIIIVSAVLMAVVVSLVLATIRYQKDKTVWKIFEYRVKTTEAMAHDLKTPLSTIMFYLESLEESAQDPDKVLEYTKYISDKVVKTDQMIGDILMLSKSESGKIELTKGEVSLKELITESLKEFPDMETDIKGDDITLTTDRIVLGQAVMNLLSNCDRYKKEGSTVDIVIGQDDLTVTNKTDRTYDDVESLKKPFVKGDESRGSKGAGLGLAITENNLDILGYKLELSSESGEFRAKIKFKT